jgi:hypothetical protein
MKHEPYTTGSVSFLGFFLGLIFVFCCWYPTMGASTLIVAAIIWLPFILLDSHLEEKSKKIEYDALFNKYLIEEQAKIEALPKPETDQQILNRKCHEYLTTDHW